MSAAARAAHLRVDGTPPLLVDEHAAALCATAQPSPLDFQLAAPAEPVLASARLTAVARARYSEDLLAAGGLRQHVVLGAGLDTCAHRAPDGVRTWLVDVPEVGAWRSRVFRAAGLDDTGVPVGVRLGAEPLLPALAAAGLALDRPVHVALLGVVMYLRPQEVGHVLTDLAALAPGSALVSDHVLPAQDRDDRGSAYATALSRMAGGAGEPWRSTATERHWARPLGETGWDVVDSRPEADAVDLGPHPLLRPQRLVQLTYAVRGADG